MAKRAEILSAADVARALGVSKRRVLQLTHAHGRGRLVAGVWMYTVADVDALQKARRPPGRPRKAAKRTA